MPASLSASAHIWAEPAVTVAFIGTLTLTMTFFERHHFVPGAAAIVTAAGGWLAHGRLLPLLATVTVITVGGALVVRRWRLALALATVAAISGSIVVEFSAFVIRHVWDQPNTANTAGSTLHRLADPAAVVSSGIGQLWYLLVSSALVFGIGATVVLRAVGGDHASKLANSHARIIVALTAPLVATSIVFMADRGRPDQWIYGRYNDAIMWPVLAIGLGWIIEVRRHDRQRVVRLAGGLAATTLACGLFVTLAHGEEFSRTRGVQDMIAGIHFGQELTGSLNPAILTLVAILASALGLRAVWNGRLSHHALAVVAAGVLTVVALTTHIELGRDLNSWAASRTVTQAATTNLPPGEVVGFRFANIAGIATVSFDDQTRFVLAYQWFLPDHQIVRDGGLTDDVGPFVFAPLSDPDLTAAGAQVLWIDPRVDIALWREPIRQSLARSDQTAPGAIDAWPASLPVRLNPIPMLMAK